MGLQNLFASMTGFFVPAIKHALVGESKDVEKWRLVFGIPAIVYSLATIGFLLFASGEVQPFDWRTYSKEDVNEDSVINDSNTDHLDYKRDSTDDSRENAEHREMVDKI